nr:hypothetical protein [Tanacetum cinerariifolium]
MMKRVDVSEESEPEPAKKRTTSIRVVKKKVIISADDNIIPNLDIALELGKSISITKAKEEDATTQVHVTHARIMTESIPEYAKKKTGSRSTRSVVIQDTPKQEAAYVMQALKESKKPSRRQLGTEGSSKGTGRILGLLDKSTVISATSSEGTGTKSRVPNKEKVSTEEKVILEWGSEQEIEYSEEDLIEEEEIDSIDSEEDDEKKYDTNDNKSIDLEMTDDEETNDEVLQGKEQVNDDEDKEMTNAEVEDSGKGDAKISDVAKEGAEKTKEAKDDCKKADLPPTSSSLSVSSGFSDQFLKLSSVTSLIGTIKDTTYAKISSLLDIKIQSDVPYIQSLSVLKVLISMIFEPSVLTSVQETPSTTHVTTLPPLSVSTIPPAPLRQSTAPIPTPPITTDALIIAIVVPEPDAISDVQLRVAKLEKDVSEIKKIDHSAKALATLKSQVPTVVEQYLGSKINDVLQKVLQRHTADLMQKYSMKPASKSSKTQTLTINLEQESKKSASKILKIKKEKAKKQKMPTYTIKSTYKATLNEYDQKNTLYRTMHENKSLNRNPANHRLKHDDDDDDDDDDNDDNNDDDDDDDDDDDPLAGPNHGKKTQRRRTKEVESSKKPSITKETPKGKALSKGPKTSKSASAKEPVEEPIAEVVMDDAGEDVVRDDDQPQDTSKTKTTKNPNPDWFKQTPRPLTLDPEWNKR